VGPWTANGRCLLVIACVLGACGGGTSEPRRPEGRRVTVTFGEPGVTDAAPASAVVALRAEAEGRPALELELPVAEAARLEALPEAALFLLPEAWRPHAPGGSVRAFVTPATGPGPPTTAWSVKRRPARGGTAGTGRGIWAVPAASLTRLIGDKPRATIRAAAGGSSRRVQPPTPRPADGPPGAT